MAVTVSIAAGHDPGYPWKSIGSAEAGAHAGKRGTTYYLDAVDKGGEPPGFWASAGLEVLGIGDGEVVDRETFERLYGEFLDPRDPSGETRLGAAQRSNPALEARYRTKLAAAGDGLTREDKRALYYQARAECDAEGSKRTGVMYWDTTFSVDKTISLAHATALARALDARARGDAQAAAVWEGRAAGIWDEIERSARVFADYMQRESRFVRTGHHGKRLDGAQGTAESGRFEDSRELPVAFFPQTTSRNGDPQIHVHMLWLNRVQTVSDDQWRAVDSRSMHRARGAASAVAALALETGLSQRFGFSWSYRDASKGRVIAGVSDRVIRAFSARRESINARTAYLVDAYRATHKGADPSRYQLHSLRQYATQLARPGKPEGLIDWHAQISDWEATARRHELGALTDLARVFWHAGRAPARAAQLTAEAERDVIAAAVAQAQDDSATFGREALVYRLAMNLPDGYLAESPDTAAAVLDGLADKAIRSCGLVRLDAGEWPRVPDRFRRASGESMFTAHGTERYCTPGQLEAEEELLRRAAAPGAPHLAPEVVARLLGAGAQDLEAQLHGAARDGVTDTGLRLNQAAAAFCALTSPRRGEVIIASAGAGKTYTAAEMARVWQAGGMGRVIGLALTSAGRNELAAAGVPECYNLAEFLGHTEEARETRGHIDIGPNALLLLDEANMTGLPDASALLRITDQYGAKIIPLGDFSQLESPSAGGALGMLARGLGYARIEEPVRFAPGWERDASLALRAGDASCLQAYDEHGRLHGGRYEEMAEQAARMYAADLLAGLDTCLSAYSHAEVADLNRRVQHYMRQAGRPAGPRSRSARAPWRSRVTWCGRAGTRRASATAKASTSPTATSSASCG